MIVEPETITWELRRNAAGVVDKVRRLLGEENYEEDKRALRGFLCNYFSAGDNGCSEKQGKSISPLGGGPTGWKRLKVRWAWPGSGKSKGLRLAVAVHCAERRVVLVQGWIRRDDPAEGEFSTAFEADAL